MSFEKPVKEENVNYDSIESIMGNTTQADGQWIFRNPADPEDIIATAQAPTAQQLTENRMEIVTTWCDAIREKVKGRRELSPEQIDAANARKKAKKEETVSDGGIVIPEGVDVSDEKPPQEVDPDGSPDEFVQSKIDAAEKKWKGMMIKEAALKEELEELEQEMKKVIKDKDKWERMKESLNV